MKIELIEEVDNLKQETFYLISADGRVVKCFSDYVSALNHFQKVKEEKVEKKVTILKSIEI